VRVLLLDGFLDLARANAARADGQMAVTALPDDSDPLDVRLPESFGLVVGVADVVSN
jgi:hypothetical protein